MKKISKGKKTGYILTDILISISIISIFTGVVASVILLNCKINNKIKLEKEGTYILECIAKEIGEKDESYILSKARDKNNIYIDIEPILKDKVWKEEILKYQISDCIKPQNYAKVSLKDENEVKISVNIKRNNLLYEDCIELKRHHEK